MKGPSEAAATAWINLMRAQREVLTAVEHDLKKAGMPPLAWYDVLLELTREEDGRLRPFQIEERTLLVQYNLSRLIDRIEAAGLVSKEPFDEDGRGRVIAITEAGRTMQQRMWQVYGPAIERNVGSRLSESEAVTLGTLLRKLQQIERR